MDPNETYRAFIRCALAVEREEAREFAGYLIDWIAKGGFEPVWRPDEKDRFYRWVKAYDQLLVSEAEEERSKRS